MTPVASRSPPAPRAAPVWLLLALCGCTALTSVGETGAELPTEREIPTVPGDTAASDDTAGEPVSDEEWQAAWFSDEVVHNVGITLSEEAWDALADDPYEFTPATATFDGESIVGLGVRLRGKVGSFRQLTGKPKFKFDFGEFTDGQRLHGLKSMALNNEVVDCSYLKEPVGYRVFRDAGLPAPRTSFAQVTVNGEDYGLYVIVEVPDGRFLSNWLPDDDEGQLYDGKYLYYPDGSYTMLDFNSGVDDQFQLEEGTENANAEIVATSAAIALAGPAFQADLDALIDWDQVHRVLAVEQWVGHVDGYAMNRNNYRVYYRQSDGKMMFIPWDFDYAFINDYEWGMSWDNPTGEIAKRCWRDPECLAAQGAGVQTVLDTIDTEALLAWYDAMDLLTTDLAKADPRRECSGPSVARVQAQVRAWIGDRSEYIRAAWAP